ncbi:MAG: hypothetical protein HYT79_05825 [Elusimicrobia bacterium]|nr:hypothetical protein [Elusimicrobiota bacterium]
MVVTTAKDAVRCPVNTGRRSLSWHSLDIRWAFEGKTDEFWRLLQDRIDRNVHAHA